MPEESGAVRSAVWGPLVQDEKSVLVGTTKNCIVQASFDEKLDYLTKVKDACTFLYIIPSLLSP